jgi:CheY-like chemotaxis protein
LQLTGATILIVDDEVRLLPFFKKWFEQEGCHVLTASSGLQALELVKTQAIDVLVSDFRMPAMDGLALVKRVNGLGGHRPRIIFLSGFAEIDERECCDLGVQTTLWKPIRRATLVDAVAACLADRDSVWRERPSVVPVQRLDVVYESLSVAQVQGLIAFGRGGICVRSGFAAHVGKPIGLDLAFIGEQRALAGQGIVRWTAPADGQIGIEINYVEERNRAWVVGLAEGCSGACFIPRSSAGTAFTSISQDVLPA